MSVEEDSIERPDLAQKICPMCGGKNRSRANRCTDCGEELRPQKEPEPSADQKKLQSLTRSLSGMYAAFGCMGLCAMVFRLEYGQLNVSGELYSAVCLFAGFGMIFVAVGVALSSLVAIRVGMWLSGIFALCLIATCAMSPLALFLIPGILQSRRILKLHEKIAHAAEENWDAGVADE